MKDTGNDVFGIGVYIFLKVGGKGGLDSFKKGNDVGSFRTFGNFSFDGGTYTFFGDNI